MLEILFFSSVFPLLCVAAALVLLMVLLIIDLRVYLLPDKYVFPFGLLGFAFHTVQGFPHLPAAQLFIGMVVGAGVLWLVRAGGSWYYGQEAMGLGDVKLLGAAGLWLGPLDVTMAMTVGAAAGLVHGIGIAIVRAIREGQPLNMHRLVLPAGPGFIVGIIAVFIYSQGGLVLELINHLIYGAGS